MPPSCCSGVENGGHVHGAVRLGSVAILDCLVFGRMAGENCAKS